jgi:hypothetical protein
MKVIYVNTLSITKVTSIKKVLKTARLVKFVPESFHIFVLLNCLYK